MRSRISECQVPRVFRAPGLSIVNVESTNGYRKPKDNHAPTPTTKYHCSSSMSTVHFFSSLLRSCSTEMYVTAKQKREISLLNDERTSIIVTAITARYVIFLCFTQSDKCVASRPGPVSGRLAWYSPQNY